MKMAIKKDPESSFLKKELAFLYMNQNSYEEALALIEEMLEKDPEDLEALIFIGNIRMYLKQKDKAKNIYEKVLSMEPKKKNIYLFLGAIYFEEGEYEKALQVYEKMVKNFPESYTGYFFLGQTHAKIKSYEDAEKEFRKALDIEPMLLEPRFELLKIYKEKDEESVKPIVITVKKGDSLKNICLGLYKKYNLKIQKAILEKNPELSDPERIYAGQKLLFPSLPGSKKKSADTEANIKKIIRLYTEILENYPDDTRANMELGIFYYKKGYKKKAEKIFNTLADRSLNDRDIAGKIIFHFIDQKKYDEAVIVLKEMLKKIPENSDMNYLAGAAYDGAENYTMALNHFKKVKENSKFFETATIFISYIYKNLNKPYKAIEHLKNAIGKVPENPEFFFHLGYCYEELEDYENAEKILKQGIEKSPENSKFLFRLGVVYDKWGKKNESIEQMKKVVGIDPQDAHALNYLGYTYLELDQNLEEAERLIQKAIELQPKDGYITDSLGWLFYKKGQFQEALATLEKAVSLVPDDPIILEHLGDVYMKMNNQEKALEFYKRALSGTKKDMEALMKKIKELSPKNE
jgi:tetratricopeptide (TPR) repeat protein